MFSNIPVFWVKMLSLFTKTAIFPAHSLGNIPSSRSECEATAKLLRLAAGRQTKAIRTKGRLARESSPIWKDSTHPILNIFCHEADMKSRFIGSFIGKNWQRVRESNPVQPFRVIARFCRKYAAKL